MIFAHLREFLDRIARRHTFLMAGGLAYATMMCVIPITLLIFSALGHLFSREVVAGRINELIDTFLPLAGYTPDAKQFLLGRVEEFRRHAAVAGIVGGLTLLFAARGLFSGMRTALGGIFPPRRHIPVVGGLLLGYARDLIMVIIVATFVGLAVAVLPGINGILTMIGQARIFGGDWDVALISAGQSALVFGLSLVTTALAFFVVYSVAPVSPPDRAVRALAAGLATLLWALARTLFGWALGDYSGIAQIYGAVGAVVVFTLWIYYSALAFLLAAEISQLWWESRERRMANENAK